MIFFKVSQNINIKITDGTLVNYLKFKAPLQSGNETIYMTTHDDFNDLKNISKQINKDNYFLKKVDEDNIRNSPDFPIELGILNEYKYKDSNKDFFELQSVDLYKQLNNLNKDEVSIAIIGGIGKSISDIVSSCVALRILHSKLKEIYKKIRFDIYISASNNSYYTRDKEIYKTQDYIDNVFPLSINSKKICEYDYFIDNSLNISRIIQELNIVDAWLFKFGLDYKKIRKEDKFNIINISSSKVNDSIKIKIENSKKKGKLFLFHPYSSNIKKSIPQSIAINLLKEFLESDEYIVVTTLNIDPKLKDGNLLNLSNESKTINDFIYIISNMDKIFTTNTSTFHIAEAFMIPTVVVFTKENYEKHIKYYISTKIIFVNNKANNFSNFIYENDNLTFYDLKAWKELTKTNIMSLLGNI